MLPVADLYLLKGKRGEKTTIEEGDEGGQIHGEQLLEDVKVFEDELGQHVVRHVSQHPEEEVDKLGALLHCDFKRTHLVVVWVQDQQVYLQLAPFFVFVVEGLDVAG